MTEESTIIYAAKYNVNIDGKIEEVYLTFDQNEALTSGDPSFTATLFQMVRSIQQKESIPYLLSGALYKYENEKKLKEDQREAALLSARLNNEDVQQAGPSQKNDDEFQPPPSHNSDFDFEADAAESSSSEEEEEEKSKSKRAKGSTSESSKDKLAWIEEDEKFLISLFADNMTGKKLKPAQFYAECEEKFSKSGRVGFSKTKLESKMKKLKTKYFKVKNHNNKSGVAPKEWEHFESFDEVLGDRPDATNKNSVSSTGKKNKTTPAEAEDSDTESPPPKKGKKENIANLFMENMKQKKELSEEKKRLAEIREKGKQERFEAKLAFLEKTAEEKRLRHELKMKKLDEVSKLLKQKEPNTE